MENQWNKEGANTYQSLTAYNFNPRKFDCDVFVSLAKFIAGKKKMCVFLQALFKLLA